MAQITATELVLRDGTQIHIRTAIETDALSTLALYQAILNLGEYTLLTVDEFQRTEDDERVAIQREGAHPSKLRVVAEIERHIVGMVRLQAGELRRTAHFAEIDSVWVLPQYWRQGIATALMNALLDWAEAHEQIEKVSLYVFSTSEAAIRLYQQHGFVIEGRCPRDIKFAENVYADTVVMGRRVDV